MEPNANNQRSKIKDGGSKDNKDNNSILSSSEDNDTSAQITYSNSSLLSILIEKERKKEIFGIDVDELLTEMKFKVLFSTNQVR